MAEGNTDTTVTCFDTEGNVLENNPFANPDKADFTITDELYQSYGFGDPRWLPKITNNIDTKKREVCQNAHLLFFKHKAPTFTSWGFVIT